jgi:hypothetical protein
MIMFLNIMHLQELSTKRPSMLLLRKTFGLVNPNFWGLPGRPPKLKFKGLSKDT